MNLKDESTQGLFLALGAFCIWGIFPIYFRLFDTIIGADEILIHRIIWSVVFMGILLYFRDKFKEIRILLVNKKIRNLLLLSGIMISINWGVYIYAVDSSRILEASLGYFMNPLMNIFVGFLVFKENITSVGKIAVFIVFLAITVQIYQIGSLPIISVVLPLSFAIYIGIRKFIKVAALDGLFVETLLMFGFAFGYFLYLLWQEQSHLKADFNGMLMIVSGIVTVVPLMMFNAATTRMKLTTLAYLQYLSPTLSMIVAVFVFKESLDIYKILSFGLIWTAILIVSCENIIIKFKGTK